MGWNALAYEGLERARKEYGVETTYVENVVTSDMAEQFRLFATQGYAVVFGHGFQFGDAAKSVAAEFPDTYFVITSSNISQSPNLASVNINDFQAGFALGAIAGTISESQIVGYVGGLDIPSITDFGDGFQEGAAYVNPQIEALAAYTGNFEDSAMAKETALAMIEKGADVLIANANQASLGALEACKEKGIRAIGYPGDQSQEGDFVVISGIKDVTLMFSDIVGRALEGTLEAKFYELGFKENAIYLSPWNAEISDEIKDKVDTIMNDLKSGAISVTKLAN